MTCSVNDCDRPPYGYLDLCTMHWQRKRRTGSIELKPKAERGCSVEGCTRTHLSRGWCGLHYGRWERNGDPLVVRPNPAMLPGPLNCKWRAGPVGYTAAHDRVRAARGSAIGLPCVDCGDPSDGWSYDHDDLDELVEADDPKRKPYSLKPEHYQPRCDACHWHVDHPTGKPTRA